MNKILLPLLAFAALAVAPVCHAQFDSAYYGLSIGDLNYDEEAFGTPFSGSADSWRLMVGFQFMEHLAVEGSYGKSSAIRDTQLADPVVVDFETEFGQFLTIRVLGTLPFENGISLMAGLGYVDFDQDVAVSVNGFPFLGGEVSDNRPAYYFGVQYDWDRVALRLSYEKLDFDTTIDIDGDVDADETSLTFFYRI